MTDDAQPLAEQCGTSVHATEALLYNLQEQKIKQAMASSYLAPGALEGKYSQIYLFFCVIIIPLIKLRKSGW